MIRRGLPSFGGGGGGGGGRGVGGGGGGSSTNLFHEGGEIDESVKRRSLRFEEWKRKKDQDNNDPKVTYRTIHNVREDDICTI